MVHAALAEPNLLSGDIAVSELRCDSAKDISVGMKRNIGLKQALYSAWKL